MLMFFTKISDSIPLMPPRSIYLKINQFIFKSSDYMREKLYKTIRISFFMFDYPMPAGHRINPTGNIDSFLMLAARINNRLLLPFFKPNSSKFGMQTKSCHIGKKNNPVLNSFLNHQEFFLRNTESLYSLLRGLNKTIGRLFQGVLKFMK